MNTNYDDEATRYEGTDNEATQLDETTTALQPAQPATSDNEVEVKATKKDGWKRAAAGAGAGLLIGGIATFLMGMKSADSTDGSQSGNNHKDELSNPEWVDDQIPVATLVNDDMSFGEAFAAAREEVGPGGCFEWHGNVYGTYTADEWNNMTPEQRAEWSDHFSWNHIDHSSSDVAQHSTTAHSSHTSAPTPPAETGDDDIEVVSVNHNQGGNVAAQNNTAHTAEVSNEVVVENVDPEVQILGVVHDAETGANIGGMIMDGQEIIVIDVDGDMEFDYMASDINGNGQIEENEVIDIQGQGLTVNTLGGYTDPTGSMLASNEIDDYSTDYNG